MSTMDGILVSVLGFENPAVSATAGVFASLVTLGVACVLVCRPAVATAVKAS